MPFLHYTPVAMPVHLPIIIANEPPLQFSIAADRGNADRCVFRRLRYWFTRLFTGSSQGPGHHALQPANQVDDDQELQCRRLRDKAERMALRYRLLRAEQAPETVLQNVLCRFNQEQVERFTLQIAHDKGVPDKSLELYLSLASQLQRHGVELGELGAAGGDGEFQPITVEGFIVEHIKRELHAHREQRSSQFLAAFDADLAVPGALRCLYAEEYQAMLEDRHWLEEELWDRLLNPASSDIQRQTAQAQLPMLNSLEQEWYQAKILQALSCLESHGR